MLNPNDYFKAAPKIRPGLNLGCLFDIPTGTYYLGKHGESILSSGLPHLTGVAGRPNTYKTALALYFTLMIKDRYCDEAMLVYDTEDSLSVDRLQTFARHYPTLKDKDLIEDKLLMLSDSEMCGNAYFNILKKYVRDKAKAGAANKRTTPFLDLDRPIKIIKPTVCCIDSLTKMTVESVEAMHDDNEIGDSGTNMEAMNEARAKSQMIHQLPSLSSRSSLYSILVAHLDDETVMNPREFKVKRLASMKQNTGFKRVPKNFSFLMNVCYSCNSSKTLQNDLDKTPLYPRDKNDRRVGDLDLQLVNVQIIRSKTGQTGTPFEIIASQREGLLPHLTNFHYLKLKVWTLWIPTTLCLRPASRYQTITHHC